MLAGTCRTWPRGGGNGSPQTRIMMMMMMRRGLGSALSETIDGIVVSCLLMRTSEDVRRLVSVLRSNGKIRVIGEDRS